MGVITEEARRWADRDYPRFEMQVTATDIARFAHATGETDPIHFDRETAIAAGYADVVAPTLFSYVIRMHASALVPPDQLELDGSPKADVPPLPTRRAMAGETSVALGERVVAGDVITVEKRLARMYEKEGRSGPLVFVEMEFTFTNQRGELVAKENFTRIYR
ncbi:MAG TPA: MaoC family dehydratase N-terminal domain-containing protein [Acidimicrobiia bacterium]|nr:MaoC family dehydratase N-terminal domain-containing protein [Acidimicrobiia bacterium]